jgi:hypothetical protein
MGGFTGFALMYSRKSLLDPSPLIHAILPPKVEFDVTHVFSIQMSTL